MQIETSIKYHNTPITMTKIKNDNTNDGEDTEKQEHAYIASVSVKLYSFSGK